jgi:hypothetical protein
MNARTDFRFQPIIVTFSFHDSLVSWLFALGQAGMDLDLVELTGFPGNTTASQDFPSTCRSRTSAATSAARLQTSAERSTHSTVVGPCAQAVRKMATTTLVMLRTIAS